MDISPKTTSQISHTFKLNNGEPVLPQAQSLNELKDVKDQILLHGAAVSVVDRGRTIFEEVSAYDQVPGKDLDPRPNHILFTSAAENVVGVNFAENGGLWPGEGTMDVQLELDNRGGMKHMIAQGESRIAHQDLDFHSQNQWTLIASTNDDGTGRILLEQPTHMLRLDLLESNEMKVTAKYSQN